MARSLLGSQYCNSVLFQIESAELFMSSAAGREREGLSLLGLPVLGLPVLRSVVRLGLEGVRGGQRGCELTAARCERGIWGALSYISLTATDRTSANRQRRGRGGREFGLVSACCPL